MRLAMDYADGGDLSARISAQRQKDMPFQQNLVINWMTQVFIALEFIHDKKVVHR